MAYSWYEPREPSVDRMYRPRPKLAQQLSLEDVDEDEGDSDSSSSSKYSEVTGSSSSLASFATTTNMTTNMTTCSSASSAPETANVFLRLRPLRDHQHTNWEDMRIQSDQSLTISSQAAAYRREMEKTFTFSGIFDSGDQQRTVYQQSVKKLIDSDRDTVVLTYGTSGSGKTYTILGTSENPGIVPRALYNLFGRYRNNIQTSPVAKTEAGKLIFFSDAEILKEELSSREFLRAAAHIETSYNVNTMLARLEREEEVVAESLGNTRVYMWVSFLEIYNERVFDLLAPLPGDVHRPGAAAAALDRRKELKVVLNAETSTVKNLRSIFVRSCEEVMQVLNYGMHQVSSGSTQINARSSRSHCIFFVDVITDTPNIGFNFTQYKFGDLAGTERLKKTENVGDRLKEAQHINTSLLVLSRCLDVLHANGTRKRKDMVPFRDSKLTMLIKAALNGLDNFVMIVNMLPALEFLDENLHVLNFASIAKQLSMKPSAEVTRRQRKQRFSKVSSVSSGGGGAASGPDYERILRRMDEVTQENYELRMLLEQSEAKLERERAERQNIVDYYKNFLAKSEASKKKHDSAVEEYNKYQLEQLRAKIRQLEREAAAANCRNADNDSESIASDDEDEEEEEEEGQPEKFQPPPPSRQSQDVVDLDSD